MKTREEILAEIVHKHFENVPAQFKQHFHKGFGEIWNVALLAMKESAEQALDLAAETVKIQINHPYGQECFFNTEYRDDNVSISINKDSILSLKDQLK